MPWIKIDDHFDEHPKHAAVGPVGWGVWLAGLAYCNRNLTDGFIPYSVAEAIGGAWKVRVPAEEDEPDEEGTRSVRHRDVVWTIDIGSGMHGERITTEWVIERLVDNGLWEQVSGGYRVHDYGDYQPTKVQIQTERAKKQAAGQAGGQASAQARGAAGAQAKSNPVPKPKPVPVPSPVVGGRTSSPSFVGSRPSLVIENAR